MGRADGALRQKEGSGQMMKVLLNFGVGAHRHGASGRRAETKEGSGQMMKVPPDGLGRFCGRGTRP